VETGVEGVVKGGFTFPEGRREGSETSLARASIVVVVLQRGEAREQRRCT